MTERMGAAQFRELGDELRLYREALGIPGYWLSNRLSTLILHETTAASSSSYDPLVVPGLLQTEEYATELIAADGLKPGHVEYWVDARMERQRVLHGRPFEFYIHEQVARYEEKLTRLSEVALDREESRARLAALASEFDRPEDSPYVPDHLAEEQL